MVILSSNWKHLLSPNVFDSLCQQNIDDSIVIGNVGDVQERVKNINVNILIFIDAKVEIEKNASYLDEYNSIANETFLVSFNPETTVDKDWKTLYQVKESNPSPVNNLFFYTFFYTCNITCKFRYKTQRGVRLSPVKYFNQMLQHYS